MTVFDPDAEWTVDPTQFVSKGRNSPYEGRTLHGVVTLTMVDGRVMHRADPRERRVLDELARVGTSLAPWATLPAVADFQDALTSVLPTERTG